MIQFSNFIPSGGGVGQPVTGLWAWYDAADTATVTIESGGRVTGWADKSGYHRDASQVTQSGQRPYWGNVTLNGYGVIEFRGGQWLNCGSASPASSGDCTVMTVARHENPASGGALLHSPLLSGNQNLGLLIVANAANGAVALRTFHRGSTPWSDYTGNGGYLDVAMYGIWRQGNEQCALFNAERGQAASAVHVTPHGDLWIGAQHHTGGVQNFLDGYVAEMLIYDRALSLSEIEANLTYLQDKWGI